MRWRISSGRLEFFAVCVLVVGCAQPLPDGATACIEPRPQLCTMVYDPVCAMRSATARQTYSNACSACADPDVVAHLPGACPG